MILPAIFQTTADNEFILWFIFGCLAEAWIISLIDKATGFMDKLDQFDDNNRDNEI
jgi:hypothetical protein